LSRIGLFTIPLGVGIFGALYGIIFSIIGFKKKIKNTQMISSIGLTFFILFLLLIIITLVSDEEITFWILYVLCFLFGIIYPIIWLKTLNVVAKEQGYNIKECQKQSFAKHKKTLIISVSLYFCMLLGIGFWIGSNIADEEELIENQEEVLYDEIGEFHEGLVSVRLNDKWGYVDSIGNEVIPLKYEEARNFSENLAPVKLNGKWGFIDKTGKEIIPFKYDNAISFDFGFAPVSLNGKMGLIDNTGKEITPLKYDDWYFTQICTEEELYYFRLKLNGKRIYVDKQGNEYKTKEEVEDVTM